MNPLALFSETPRRTKPRTVAAAKPALPAKAALVTTFAMFAALLTGCTATASQSDSIEVSPPQSTQSEQKVDTAGADGHMQLKSYSGTLNSAKISFEYPDLWSVVEGPEGLQPGQPDGLEVNNQAGDPMATLVVLNVVGFRKPPDILPVHILAVSPGHELLSETKDFTVQTLAMDLSGRPQAQARNGWTNNVRVGVSISAGPANKPEEMQPELLTSMVSVETGVPIYLGTKTSRPVSFATLRDFDSMEAAKEYTKGSEFTALQKMLASFKG